MAYLTDRALASGVTLSDLLHIVITGDTSQNLDGSSYKATIQQVGDALSGSSFNTYVFSGNADVATSTLTFLNNDGGTFTVTNSAALFSDNDINVTGGTYNPSNGCVTFTTNSGTTFDVCGFLTGFTDTYVTGGTYSAGTATFTNTSGGTFDVTGFTSGDTNFANTDLTLNGNRFHNLNGNYLFISDALVPTSAFLYLEDNTGIEQVQIGLGGSNAATFNSSNILLSHGLNAISINSTETIFNNNSANIDFRVEGDTEPNLLFADASTDSVGIGTSTPIEKLHIDNGDILVENTSGKFFTDIENSSGALVILSSKTDTDIHRISVKTPNSDSISMGVRGSSDVSYPGYGNQGDSFIYSSNPNNGINIISSQGTGTDDYIRFYAGQNANGTTPDLYIQGSGSTRGYVGINNDSPSETLDVNGNTKISGSLNIGTVLGNTPIGNLGFTIKH
jgi:hypothetical protein